MFVFTIVCEAIVWALVGVTALLGVAAGVVHTVDPTPTPTAISTPIGATNANM